MKLLLKLLSFILVTSCYYPERDCAKFTNGNYQTFTYVNSDTLFSTITRDDRFSIETFDGKTDTSTVRWVNSCEYVLRKVNPNSRKERDAIHIKILNTTDTSYTFEYGKVGSSKKLTGIAIKK